MSAKIIPTLRYADAPAAIDWLERAFGFQRLIVVPGEDGTIRHSQLTFENGIVMVGSERDDEYGETQRAPVPDGPVTQSVYVIVEDVDAHCARAREAGARVIIEPEDQGPRGRFYSCRDPEGHLWSFGVYDPFADA